MKTRGNAALIFYNRVINLSTNCHVNKRTLARTRRLRMGAWIEFIMAHVFTSFTPTSTERPWIYIFVAFCELDFIIIA